MLKRMKFFRVELKLSCSNKDLSKLMPGCGNIKLDVMNFVSFACTLLVPTNGTFSGIFCAQRDGCSH